MIKKGLNQDELLIVDRHNKKTPFGAVCLKLKTGKNTSPFFELSID